MPKREETDMYSIHPTWVYIQQREDLYKMISNLMIHIDSYILVQQYDMRNIPESPIRCFKCDGSFCLHCKVPWHSALSCNKYKKLYPNPQVDEDFAKFPWQNAKGGVNVVSANT
uniref:IBR domain-containing protein n=1 Tax=Brassica oleracea var. oleracea TaxID=109376 RepID=A0A0D3B2H6_BRAOL